MTLRPATMPDHPEIAAFLRGHEPSSIFPLANLVGTARSPQQLWLAGGPGGPEGVIALASSGFLMPQWPGLDAGAVAQALRGCRVAALIGEAGQVEALQPLFPSPKRIGREPLCTLDLDRLIQPDPEGCHLAPIRPEDAETAIHFRIAYNRETNLQPAANARTKAEADVAQWMQADSHRLLWQGGAPVALTGLNARLPEVVQVGGVFTPSERRSRGHARRAVALHLAEARAAGARRAVLFAATDAALRAYRAIGFTQIGWMGVTLLDQAVTL